MSANLSWIAYLTEGIMSPNEARAWLGLAPLCDRCGRYVTRKSHRRLHARGKKPRCRK